LFKKFIAAVAVVLGIVMFIPAPAQAVEYWNESHCHNLYVITVTSGSVPVTTCVEVRYRLQDDGAGLRIEDLWITMNHGCSAMESFPKIKNAVSYLEYPQYTVNYSTWEGDIMGSSCSYYKDMEFKGQENNNKQYFSQHLELNVNNGSNKSDDYDFAICPNNAC